MTTTKPFTLWIIINHVALEEIGIPDYLISPEKHVCIERENVEVVTDFLLGSKITADGACSQEIRRQLLFGRKAMTNLDTVLKSRDITVPTNAHIVKVMVFPIIKHDCESWTIKNAEQ